MYHHSGGYLVSIVRNGNVIQPRSDSVVSLPFGSEYTIRLTNHNSRRALAKVFIDGANVTGGGIIVSSNDLSVDLERPTDKSVKFKFVSVESREAYEHGKGGPDTDGSKGLIKVEWLPESKRETVYRKMQEVPIEWPAKSFEHYRLNSSKEVLCGQHSVMNRMSSGATVEGSYSNQNFRTVEFEVDRLATTIVTAVKLMGYENPLPSSLSRR